MITTIPAISRTVLVTCQKDNVQVIVYNSDEAEKRQVACLCSIRMPKVKLFITFAIIVSKLCFRSVITHNIFCNVFENTLFILKKPKPNKNQNYTVSQ